jgi:hypothetical protein
MWGHYFGGLVRGLTRIGIFEGYGGEANFEGAIGAPRVRSLPYYQCVLIAMLPEFLNLKGLSVQW